jgi:hypothetical protein
MTAAPMRYAGWSFGELPRAGLGGRSSCNLSARDPRRPARAAKGGRPAPPAASRRGKRDCAKWMLTGVDDAPTSPPPLATRSSGARSKAESAPCVRSKRTHLVL